MMKKISLAIMALVVLNSCQKDNEIADLTAKSFDYTITTKAVDNLTSRSDTDHCLIVNLIAGQQYISGDVAVDIINGKLVINYLTDFDWVLKKTHLLVGSKDDIIESGKEKGNPSPGLFKKGLNLDMNILSELEVEYSISISDLDFNGNDIYIAAHAEVSKSGQKETAWAGSLYGAVDGINTFNYGDRNWAMYFKVTKSEAGVNCGGEQPG